ncbi:MAG: hypothetical protein IPL32_20245 [Chloracidobacterium sp.]|nr:hypothetical protein [Chloracidobacterium sp.]
MTKTPTPQPAERGAAQDAARPLPRLEYDQGQDGYWIKTGAYPDGNTCLLHSDIDALNQLAGKPLLIYNAALTAAEPAGSHAFTFSDTCTKCGKNAYEDGIDLKRCEPAGGASEFQSRLRLGLSCGHTWNGTAFDRCPQCGDVAAEQPTKPQADAKADREAGVCECGHRKQNGVCTRPDRHCEECKEALPGHRHFCSTINPAKADREALKHEASWLYSENFDIGDDEELERVGDFAATFHLAQLAKHGKLSTEEKTK